MPEDRSTFEIKCRKIIAAAGGSTSCARKPVSTDIAVELQPIASGVAEINAVRRSVVYGAEDRDAALFEFRVSLLQRIQRVYLQRDMMQPDLILLRLCGRWRNFEQREIVMLFA